MPYMRISLVYHYFLCVQLFCIQWSVCSGTQNLRLHFLTYDVHSSDCFKKNCFIRTYIGRAYIRMHVLGVVK